MKPIEFPTTESEEISSLTSKTKVQKTENGVGSYTFVKKIGSGTYGCVKLATHNKTKQKVAIKILQKSQIQTKICDLQKMYREMQILKMLDHPNIVKLYQIIETDDKLYLVMEYMEGGELYDKIKKHGPMVDKDARELIRQLVSAIQYCHAKGIAHRDLKLENILLDRDGKTIKLIDFGFSNFTSHYSKLSTFCGSPPYAAPELFQGIEYNGFKTDIWALGVIIYTITTASLPFDGANVNSIRVKVESANFRIPPYMSVSCTILVKQCITIDPVKRSNIYDIMKNRWITMDSGVDELDPYAEPNRDIIDDRRVKKLLLMGFKRPEIEDSFVQKKYNEIFALYTMIKEEDLPKKQESVAKKSKFSEDKVDLNYVDNRKTRSAQKDLIQMRSQKTSALSVNMQKPVRTAISSYTSFTPIRRNLLSLDSRSRLIDKSPAKDSSVNQENDFAGWSSKFKDLELKPSLLVRNVATRSTFHAINTKKQEDLPQQETPAKPAFLKRLISKLDINFKLFSSKKDVANNK